MQNQSGLVSHADGLRRCWWCGTDPLYMRYHDQEWGQPVRADQQLFEKICLEGFQAGLSWLTILRKRENFRAAFAGFDFTQVAGFGEGDIARLLADAGIVRHRGKIASTINNAQRAAEMVAEVGSLAGFFWQFEPRRRRRLSRQHDMLATSEQSQAMSKALKRRGWTFVGPTTCYAFMQAMGMVNDHLHGCQHWQAVEQARERFQRPQIA